MKILPAIILLSLFLDSVVYAQRAELSLQMYSLQEGFDTDTPGTLDWLKSEGIRDIETSVFTKLPANELRKLLDARGMTCSSHHVRPGDLEMSMEKVIADAKALGAIQVVCPILPHKPPLSRAQVLNAAANFNRFGETLKNAGLKFAYHNHSQDFLPADTPSLPGETFYDVLIAATQPDVVHFQLDVFWVTWGGKKAVDVIDKHGARLCSLHLKDLASDAIVNIADPKRARPFMVQLTTGQVDIPRVIAAAKKHGISHLVIEDESPRAALQIPKSNKSIQEILDRDNQ